MTGASGQGRPRASVSAAPSVRLLAAGDTALGGVLRGRDSVALTEGLAPLRERFAAADLRFLSFDCAIGTAGEPPHADEYLVDCDLEALALLENLDIDVVSLANNHSTDRGMAALAEGAQRLRTMGPRPVGVGQDLAAAVAPVVVETGGLRLGFLAFASDHPWVGALTASTDTAGVAPLRPELALSAVTTLRPTVDAVVVSLHWGKEYIPLPSPGQVELARRLVDSGATVVLGHHPHVIQPVEAYGGGVICYSLGNFLFGDDPSQGLAFSGAQRESFLVTVEVRRTGARLAEVLPVVADEVGRVAPVGPERARQIETELAAAGALLGTAAHPRAWQAAVRQHELRRLRRVLRDEVLAAGWRGGSARLLRLGRKNLLSVGRSLGDILAIGRRRA